METVQLVALIKSTIMALQHANQTGNYSVLRDLGSPVFRERFRSGTAHRDFFEFAQPWR